MESPGSTWRRAAVNVTRTVLEYEPAHLADVRFTAYGDQEYETVRSVVESARHETGS